MIFFLLAPAAGYSFLSPRLSFCLRFALRLAEVFFSFSPGFLFGASRFLAELAEPQSPQRPAEIF